MTDSRVQLQRLEDSLRRLGPVAVAVSGGVDSMTLASVAHATVPGSEMFHAVSPAVPLQATARVHDHAKRQGWILHIIDAGEISDPAYLANPVDRCYVCKSHLYQTLAQASALPLVSGTNLDDLGDYRPGLNAAAENAVHHPFVEAGIDKNGLRAIANQLGLTDLSELPAAPCLSSRVTTGIAIDPELLPLVNAVEVALWDALGSLDPTAVRCRVRPAGLVVEIATDSPADNLDVIDTIARDCVQQVFSPTRFAYLADTVKTEPYRQGSAFLIETVNLDS